MCATEEQFPRLNSTASINLKPRICYFLRVPWQPSCFWNLIWSVTTVTSSPSNDSKSPADLAHAASDVGVHHDDQERHEDQVGVAENIFQHEQLKPVKMIETIGKQMENTNIIANRLSSLIRMRLIAINMCALSLGQTDKDCHTLSNCWSCVEI